MSDEPASSPDTSSPAPEPATRVRRISNPRPKKAAKTAKTAKVADEAPAAAVESAAPTLAAAPSHGETAPSPVSASYEEARENGSSQENDWPEPEPAQTGGGSQESGKRKRRRRKGKGQSSGGPVNASQGGEGETPAFPAESKPADFKAAEPKHPEPRPNPPQGGGYAQPQQQRQRFDPELISKLALKIYLAEVSEEGVALIGDNDAKELSRRCFRLAEIFIEEQSRRR